MKKFISIILVLIISIFYTLPVRAEDATEATEQEDIKTNLWTYENWDIYLSNVDLTQYDFDYLRDVEFDYNFIKFDKTSTSVLKGIQTFFFNAEGMYYADKILYCDNCPRYNYSDFAGSLMTRNLGYNETTSKYSTSIGMYYQPNLNSTVNNNIWIISDYDIYKSVANAYPDFGAQIFYCQNPLQSFLDYVDRQKYDDMFYDVYQLKDGCQNIIRFYDCFDSYYGKYQYSFYDDNMLNYLNSSYSLSCDLYYTSSATTTGDQNQQLQHNESVNLYIPLSSDYVSKLSDDNTASIINSYLNSIGSAIHYERGLIDFSTWYDTYIKPWLKQNGFNTEYKIVTLKNVEPSSKEKVTVNKSDKKQDIYLIRLTFPNSYSFIESGNNDGSFMMSGCRTMSSARLIELHSGSLVDTTGNGFGSDINGGDYSDNRERDDLLADGWKNGYPNRSSYPYKVTLNKNGKPIYEVYFDKKPAVSSDFFSDSQISYLIDFNYTRGYVYSVEHNCYVNFDFRTNVEDDYLNSDGTIIDSVTDSVKKNIIDTYYKLINLFVNGVGYTLVEDYDYVDYDKLYREYIIKFWTNYTGQLHGVYRGYYVQFNWDLESDPNFIKNNSDDTHNYSDDFLEDKGFVDNNGNTHGGAVELPTSGSVVNGFNNEDFSFDENNLWTYANSFLDFSAKAFSVLPSFIWQLIACSMVIVIFLRILGR